MPLKVSLYNLCDGNRDTELLVIKDVNNHELICTTTGELLHTWEDCFIFSESEPVPQWHGGFIKVECREDAVAESLNIAVWADPSNPFLADALPTVPPAHEHPVKAEKLEPVTDVLKKSASNLRRALQEMTP